MSLNYTVEATFGYSNLVLFTMLCELIFLSVMTTNGMAVYDAAMSYMNIRPQDGFWRPTLIIVIITTVGALYEGIPNQFQSFLLIIGPCYPGLRRHTRRLLDREAWTLRRR